MSESTSRADGTSSERPDSTSLSLLQRVQQGDDQEAWRRLVHLYGPLVYQWCRRWELQSEDAADIFQDVFQAVAAQIAGFRRQRPGDSFRGWLWTITRNKIGDHFRRRSRQPSADGGSAAQQRLLSLPEEPPLEADGPGSTSALVQRALELIRPEFEDRTWRAFWRVAVDGHAPREVASELGVTADAIRMAKSRVLRRLRAELEGLHED